MNTTLTGQQRLYQVYRTLSSGVTDFTDITTITENSLFRALEDYVGSIQPAVDTNVYQGGTYTATPEEQAWLLSKLRSVDLSNGESTSVGDTFVTATVKSLEVLCLYFSKESIFDEVYKRTSYIARSRRDKETKEHLLDLIALTKDDDSIFLPFLRDASSKVFEALAPFTRTIDGAHLHLSPCNIEPPLSGVLYNIGDWVLHDGIIYEVIKNDYVVVDGIFDSTTVEALPDYLYTDNKVLYLAVRPPWTNANAITSIDTAAFEALVSYVMARWFTVVFPEEAKFYYAEYDQQLSTLIRQLNANKVPMKRKPRWF